MGWKGTVKEITWERRPYYDIDVVGTGMGVIIGKCEALNEDMIKSGVGKQLVVETDNKGLITAVTIDGTQVLNTEKHIKAIRREGIIYNNLYILNPARRIALD